jgi:hypothetical protein
MLYCMSLGLATILLYLFAISFSDSDIRNKYYFDGIRIDGCFFLQECFRMYLDYDLLMFVFWHFETRINPGTRGQQIKHDI